jgi:acetyl-CoA/propionyl-CoA carboxylase, biotin carboxylase, biotin carboxyl carrier protein
MADPRASTGRSEGFGPAVREFSTLLVANRGEIAVRVIRAARAAGLRTVAVYSDADRGAPHVREADTAVRLGPAPAAESYLSIEALLRAATVSAADAVHPGYGFLSERADFARAVADAGLVWVGPPAEAMEAMGRKDRARDIAERAGVPVVPRFGAGGAIGAGDPYDEPIGAGDPRAKTELAQSSPDASSYPVLVKAATGGGGKGMRIVREPADLADALAAAGREAAAAFGDDTLLIERYVERGRHVEVQIVADSHGNVAHLFERDCSTQRRHQKVIEEAPAPTISDDTRAALYAAAVALAKEVGYAGAGTVEFLVDEADEQAYFLEMNTRLQVEHPVTEAIAGVDLVRLQLAIAAGAPLPPDLGPATPDGHAIEVRIYAEDPYNGFLPQAGIASTVVWPDTARVDAALESGQEISTAYDPLLGKIIVHGTTREAARQAMLQALDDTAILGLTTNVGFLRQLAASTAFRDAAIDTAWLDRHLDEFARETPDEIAVIAAWWLADQQTAADPAHPFGVADGWRLAGPAAPILIELDDLVATVDRAAGTVATRDRTWRVRPIAGPGAARRLEIDGVIHEAYVEIDRHTVTVGYRGQPHVLDRPDAFGPAATTTVSDGSVTAPMPGTVLDVRVTAGQSVRAGETLGVMEAMKMELALKAPNDGTVATVDAFAGQQVGLGETLFVVEATP